SAPPADNTRRGPRARPILRVRPCRGATGCCASKCSYRVPPVVELAGFYQGIRHRGRPARRGILGSAESLRGRDTDMTDTAPCYLFLDCDRFYFAVEAAERPGLADDPRPVIIGRDPRTAPRGIVTTANDPARALGIRSGLSPALAPRLGPKAEAQLRAAGIETIGGLAGRSRDALVTLFGRAYGRYLSDASRGVDHRTLSAERAAKSISAEHTFPHDTTDRGVLRERLRSQAEEVSARLAQEGLRAEEVAIKLRYANWQTLTRQTKLRVATADAEALAASATGLMQLHWDPTRAVRLIGL